MDSLIALIVLVIAYVISIKLLWLAYSSIHWPTVEGTIVESSVLRVDWDEDPHFKPLIRYKFKVRSSSFESDNIMYQSFNPVLTEDQALEKISDFNVGDKVIVYHHPSKPGESVLLPGLSHHQKALVIAIVIMTVILVMLGANVM
ncbi:DUF3592 domain-containing protein [Alteromonas sp. 5E99-2]|uniref:DUF3592 domain-containing protein n=1 Tax=Alteromonas sp. 5E99-2 TaxID=2817683 RepID=UPI001A991112|nr:DUF3592 domain-containing protein [Alteromonas sp. 5E99-2]MBO1257095.1 DUF3592 domain-containing protein [Alteromonas sp. 5E99-2]